MFLSCHKQINYSMKSLTNQFILSILAGISISIGCIINLKVGCGIAGSVLFSIGLMMVVLYKYKLFTGTAGFIESIKDVFDVLFIYLIGNVIGTYIMGVYSSYFIPETSIMSETIMNAKISESHYSILFRSILCGILMSYAVYFAKNTKNYVCTVVIAVSTFIMGGFYHCIADSFYMFNSLKLEYITDCKWITSILGNFIGCNIWRLQRVAN